MPKVPNSPRTRTLAFLLVLGAPGPQLRAATYYVDATGGDDANSGTSEGAAWKSLDKANSPTYGPGDKILFKCGGTWTGMFQPKGSGDASAPVTADKYGAGNRPLIQAMGQRAAVLLLNVEYWTVQGLEMTNTGGTNTTQRRGVQILSTANGPLRGIVVRDLYIHNVDKGAGGGDPEIPETGGDARGLYADAGVRVYALRNGVPYYDGITIEDITFKDMNVIDVMVFGQRSGTKHKHVVVRNVTATNQRAMGIIICQSDAPLVEHAQILIKGGAGAGIFPFQCANPTFRYCEVGGINDGIGTNDDGCAFDTDSGNRGLIIWEYGYTHGNGNGQFFDMESDSSIVRYCISQNEPPHGKVHGTVIFHNNVYYHPAKAYDGGWGTIGGAYNNIYVYAAGSLSKQGAPAGSVSNNLYSGFAPPAADKAPLTGDPMFVDPGKGGDGMNTVDGYKLKAGSPCVNQGVKVNPYGAGDGGADFWGDALKDGMPDIGAYEYGGGPSALAASAAQAGWKLERHGRGMSLDLDAPGPQRLQVISPAGRIARDLTGTGPRRYEFAAGDLGGGNRLRARTRQGEVTLPLRP